MVPNCGRCLLQNLLVNDLAVRVDLVDDRDTGRKLRVDDLLTGHVLESHDHGAERVAVGSNKDRLALLDSGLDVLLEEGEHTLSSELQRLAARGDDVVRTAPGVHLLLTELGTSVVLVEAGELTVVALVQGLVLRDGDVLLADGLELDTQGLLGALQSRGEGETATC